MNRNKVIGLIPVVAYILLIVIISIFDPFSTTIFNPPFVPTLLNIIFVTGTGTIVALLSARAYYFNGNVSLLLLGAGALAGGLASLIGGYSANFVSGNYGVTTHNVDMVLSSGLQLLSAVATIVLIGSTDVSRRFKYIIVAYASVVLFSSVTTVLIYTDQLPIFLTASGPTMIRQVVLGLTIIMFSLSSVIFFLQYSRGKSSGLYWYSMGLALFAIGMFCLLFQVKNGDLNSWIGRMAQYTGGFYFVIAVFSLRTGATEEPDLAERWAETFGTDRRQFSTFFASMLNAFIYGRVIVDKVGKPQDIVVLDVNDAFERMMGIGRGKAVGKTVSSLIPGIKEDSNGWVELFGGVSQTREPSQFESYLKPLDKWFNISIYSPKKGYFVAILDDMTERKRAEGALRKIAHDLQESNAELQQFAYVASHDLQEPLRMVMSYLGLLDKKYGDILPEQAHCYMDTALSGAERMRQLINDLLLYSRIDAQSGSMSSVDMNEMAKLVVADLKVPIEEAGAEIVINPLPLVWADDAQMKQVLQNLISNGIKFRADQPPLIEVSAVTYDDEFVFSVRDNGIGIDPKYADKLFKMFSRLHTNDEYPGTGIGLAISKKIVERHGGRIWFESEPGKGTTFFFTIPV